MDLPELGINEKYLSEFSRKKIGGIVLKNLF